MTDSPRSSPGRGWKLLAASLLFLAMLGCFYWSFLRSGPAPAEETTPSDAPGAGIAVDWAIRRNTPLPVVDFNLIHSHLGSDLPMVLAAEKEALRVYDQHHPATAPYYQAGRMAVQLFACGAASGDPHGACLFQLADAYGCAARLQGCADPVMMAIGNVYIFAFGCSRNAAEARRAFGYLQRFLDSDYPPLLKEATASIWLKNLANVDTSNPALAAFVKENLDHLTDLAVAQFKAFAATKPSTRVLTSRAIALIGHMEEMAASINRASGPLVDILTGAGATEADQADFKGNLLISLAWAARGFGWASTVTATGQQGMDSYLRQADDVLEKAADKFPKDPRLAAQMINVELGQGEGKYRMNLWFQRAITADPDYCRAYSLKMYYLQPKWYGSLGELVQFGQECIATGRWEAAIPMVFIGGLLDLGDAGTPAFFADPRVWTPVQQTCVEDLRRYPESLHFRTAYLCLAVRAGQWQVAREQLRLLGEDYDHSVLYAQNYAALRAKVDAHR